MSLLVFQMHNLIQNDDNKFKSIVKVENTKVYLYASFQLLMIN